LSICLVGGEGFQPPTLSLQRYEKMAAQAISTLFVLPRSALWFVGFKGVAVRPECGIAANTRVNVLGMWCL
jgi:hypothetical protein